MQNIQDIFELQATINKQLKSEIVAMKLDNFCRVAPIADYIIRKVLNNLSIKLTKDSKQFYL